MQILNTPWFSGQSSTDLIGSQSSGDKKVSILTQKIWPIYEKPPGNLKILSWLQIFPPEIETHRARPRKHSLDFAEHWKNRPLLKIAGRGWNWPYSEASQTPKNHTKNRIRTPAESEKYWPYPPKSGQIPKNLVAEVDKLLQDPQESD